MESRGPAFYFQQRVKKGKSTADHSSCGSSVLCTPTAIRLYLRAPLRGTPSLADEWRSGTRKLRRDPRRRDGRRPLLRKLSLDELPQLWNVLIGDMSVVGPRPIVKAEIAKYHTRFASYAMVRPGITGLWQVSGRNTDTSYDQRIPRLDEYYVRNWSVWLDVYVLARTIRTVLFCEGAY